MFSYTRPTKRVSTSFLFRNRRYSLIVSVGDFYRAMFLAVISVRSLWLEKLNGLLLGKLRPLVTLFVTFLRPGIDIKFSKG